MLGLKPVETPFWLGEDDLAEFGTYREDPGRAAAPGAKDTRDSKN